MLFGFNHFVDMTQIKDSYMMTDGSPIAAICFYRSQYDTEPFEQAVIGVVGNATVNYKGRSYTGAGSFPLELVDYINNGGEIEIEEYNAFVIQYKDYAEEVYIAGFTDKELYELLAYTIITYEREHGGKDKAVPEYYEEYLARIEG